MLPIRYLVFATAALVFLLAAGAALAETKKIRISATPKDEIQGYEQGSAIPTFFKVQLRQGGKTFDEEGKEMELKNLKPADIVMVTFTGNSSKLLQATKIERLRRK